MLCAMDGSGKQVPGTPTGPAFKINCWQQGAAKNSHCMRPWGAPWTNALWPPWGILIHSVAVLHWGSVTVWSTGAPAGQPGAGYTSAQAIPAGQTANADNALERRTKAVIVNFMACEYERVRTSD